MRTTEKFISRKRKFQKSILLVSFLSVFTISCDELLETDVETLISEDLYADEAGMQKALAGAYNSLGGVYDGFEGGQLFGGDFTIIPTLAIIEGIQEFQWLNRGAATEYNPFASTVKDFTQLRDNSRVESNWRRGYETINIVNSIIANIEKIEDQSTQNKIHGEALGIRGILYFEMARLWAPEYDPSTLGVNALPLLIEPITKVSDIQPATMRTVEAIYGQITNDLSAASTLLDGFGTNEGRVSYYACQAYLMRAAMHMENYPAAVNHANNILDEVPGTFQLTNEPLAAFNNPTNSSEDIFAMQQTPTASSGNIATGTGISIFYSSLQGEGNGNMRVRTSYLYNTLIGGVPNSPQFAPQDIRGQVDDEVPTGASPSDIASFFYVNNQSSSIFKSPAKYLTSGNNIPIVRLAEVYLTRGEALQRINGTNVDPTAISDLNSTRTRAGLVAYNAADFGTGQAIVDSLKLERKREFFMEGVIFHDLKRWGDSIDDVPATDSRYLLPIPQNECDASPGLCD